MHRSVNGVRIGIAAFGVVLAIAGMTMDGALVHALLAALLPALLMTLTLATGSLLATVAALLVAAVAWQMIGDTFALQVMTVAVIAVAGGEALRRGVDPLLLAVPLAGVGAVNLVLLQGAQLPLMQAASRALVEACAGIALAALALLLLPRRSRWLPARTRTRLRHLCFLAMPGAVALVSLGALSWLAQQETGRVLAARLAPGLAVAVLVAAAASVLLGLKARSTLQKLQAQAGAAHPTRATRSLPRELHRTLLDFVIRRRRLERRLNRDAQALQALHRTAESQAGELQRTRDALRQRSSELRRTLAAGATTRARHDALMDCVPAAALFTDREGRIHSANRAALSLLGYSPEELRGQHIGSLIPDEHLLGHPLARGEDGQLHSTRRAETCRVRRQDGAVRELATQVMVFAVDDQSHCLVLLREADSTRRAMAALEQARATAQQMRQSRDMFIATMSHEMRTPLHGLIATLDMLRTNEAMGDVHNQLTIARSSARALLKIANDVLDFTRIGSSEFDLEHKPFGMTRVLREVVEEALARASSLGLTLDLELRTGLPPAFIGDAARLKQILANLVSNALKFTREGGVRMDVAWDGSQCYIEVHDTGEGVPEEQRERIFEPFVQAQSNVRAQIGTGLGLPISRRLAEAMGGSLVLAKTGPGGSTFRVTLKLETSDELPPEEQSLRVFRNPRGRILVVEDNPANRYVAKALLNGLECPATIVEGGELALELLEKQDFDLILMDCQMPGIDGYETSRRARRMLKRHVPIIAMTANAMANDRKECLEAGMDDFLPKPFDRRALNDILCKWLAPPAATSENMEIGRRVAQMPDLDARVLDELFESLQWRIAPLNQIRSTFNDSLKPLAPLLRSAGPADRGTLQRHLHTLLGSSGMVGARQIEFLAGHMRHAIHEQQFDKLAACADELERAMGRYNREFEAWLEKSNKALRSRPLRIVNDQGR